MLATIAHGDDHRNTRTCEQRSPLLLVNLGLVIFDQRSARLIHGWPVRYPTNSPYDHAISSMAVRGEARTKAPMFLFVRSTFFSCRRKSTKGSIGQSTAKMARRDAATPATRVAA